jgi:SAM-dependent methyltransferase
MHPLPEKDVLDHYYEESYWEKHHDQSGLVNKTLDNSFDSRSKEIYEWSKAYIKDTNTKVLEIGAGYGHTLAYFKQQSNCYVEGVEPSKEGSYNAINSYGIKTFNGFLEDFQTNEKFDIIILSHVFEHFYNPDEALVIIRKLIRDEGVLFIEVPNILQPNPIKHKLGWFSKEHISYFSKNKLNFMLSKNGFDMIRSEEKNYLRTLSIAHFVKPINYKKEHNIVKFAILKHDLLYYRMRLLQKLKIKK